MELGKLSELDPLILNYHQIRILILEKILGEEKTGNLVLKKIKYCKMDGKGNGGKRRKSRKGGRKEEKRGNTKTIGFSYFSLEI